MKPYLFYGSLFLSCAAFATALVCVARDQWDRGTFWLVASQAVLFHLRAEVGRVRGLFASPPLRKETR